MTAPDSPASAPPASTGPSQPAGPRRVAGSVLQRMDKGTIRRVVAVGSGKGGVGKSAATALLAAELRRRGLAVGVLDADVTGPSQPKLFGLSGPLVDRGEGIEPARSAGGVPVVSSQFLVEDEQTPVIWRGPLVTRLILQFFGGVNWGPLDYLLIDMPPGTSDVPLTVFQSVPLDGMVFVFTPPELSAMIVKKAMNMARDLHVPLLGIVENMAWVACPHCATQIRLFGETHATAVAREYEVPIIAELPVDPALARAADDGRIESYTSDAVARYADAFLASVEAHEQRRLTVL